MGDRRGFAARCRGARCTITVVAAVVVVGVGGSSATGSAAGAVTRQQATAVALKLLKPRRGTVVFGLPTPVAAKQKVGEAVSGAVEPAGRRAWLFWQDQAPHAQFRHPSRLLLVDAATGKVIRDQRLGWWPLLGGKLLPFSPGRPGYVQKRYRVHPVLRGKASRGVSAAAAPLRAGGPSTLPQSAFAGDCLVTVGATNDPVASTGFPVWERWAKSRGIPTFRTDPGADGTAPEQHATTGDLGVTIGKAVKAKCTDVVVYLAGHGKEPPLGKADRFADGGSFNGSYGGIPASAGDGPSDLPAVSTVSGGLITPAAGSQPVDPDITSKDLRELIVAFGKQDVTFKVIVESCYSGRFANDLRQKTPGNLLFVGTSTGAAEVGYSFIKLPQGYKGDSYAFDHVYYKNGKRLTRYVKVDLPKRAPEDVGEFTHGFMQGWNAFESSQVQVDEAAASSKATGIPFLVYGLRDAMGAVSRFDLAAKSGITKPKLLFPQQSQAPPPVKQTSAVLDLNGKNATLTVSNAPGGQPIMFLRYVLPQGVQATGIGAPPPGCQVGAPTAPPSPLLIVRCTPPIQPGATTTFRFTTNGVAPKAGDGGTLYGSATGQAGSDVLIPVTLR